MNGKVFLIVLGRSYLWIEIVVILLIVIILCIKLWLFERSINLVIVRVIYWSYLY